MQLLLVEDDLHVRNGLSAAFSLRSSFAVRVCGTVAQALELLESGPVDVVLVDLGLPDGSGEQVIRRVRTRHPQATVLVITLFDDDATIMAALRAGAHGYLLKHGTQEQLVTQVEQALSRGAVLSPEVVRRVVASFWSSNAPSASVHLGKREIELLEHLHAGRSYQEAAAHMALQLGTIQGYVKRMYRKLGAASKVDALRIAIQQGLLRP